MEVSPNKAEKEQEVVYIFRPYITLKDGRRIYPKKAKYFKVPITKDKAA